ncbi:Mitochondrial porin, partial [Massospora cicadina]
MAPVAFPDLDKAVKDLFTRDYPVGQARLEVKTITSNGVNLTVTGHQDVKTGHIFGEGKVKYFDFKNGLTVTNAVTTNNLLTTQIELENKASRGIKLDILAGYLPMTSQKNLRANVYYKHALAHVRVATDVFKGPIFNVDFVAGQDGVFVGGETSYDVEKGSVAKCNASVAYMHRDFTAALHSTDSFGTFAGTFYQRVNPDVDVGLGTKYSLDKEAFVKAKVDNQGKLGLAYTQLLKPGIKLSLGGSFDTAKLNEPSHKI